MAKVWEKQRARAEKAEAEVRVWKARAEQAENLEKKARDAQKVAENEAAELKGKLSAMMGALKPIVGNGA